MRLLALVLLVGVAHAQGLTTNAPGVTGGGKVLARFPLTTSGALIEEDANTVAHVYWEDGTIHDTKGNVWAMQGTVPSVTANPFTTTRYGAGPFSGSNYYSLASTNPLQFAGDYTCHVVFRQTAQTANAQLLFCGTPSSKGWGIGIEGGGNLKHNVYTGAANEGPVTGNTLVNNGPGIVSVGRSGANTYVKLNLGTTGSVAKVPVEDSSCTTYLGTYSTTNPFIGTIYEATCTSTPFTEATVTAIQQRVLGHYDGTAPLTVTRATNATYEKDGTIWTVPPGVARITSTGLLRERASTNYVLNSRTHAKAAQATATLPTGTYVGRHAGTGTMTIAAGTATMADVDCSAVAAGTVCPFTVTVTGTALITTEAGVTRAQIEPGTATTYTSWIDTGAAAVTRNADVVTFTAPAGTTWETLTNAGVRSGATASPGTITLPEGTISNVKVCGKAKSLKDCK